MNPGTELKLRGHATVLPDGDLRVSIVAAVERASGWRPKPTWLVATITVDHLAKRARFSSSGRFYEEPARASSSTAAWLYKEQSTPISFLATDAPYRAWCGHTGLRRFEARRKSLP